MNEYRDIDPYGEEIWGDDEKSQTIYRIEHLYGFEYLESIRGLYDDVDIITDRLIKERDELQIWFQMPWWKKMFNKPKFWL